MKERELLGSHTNVQNRRFFEDKIRERLEELKKEEEWGQPLEDILEELNRLKEHVYGLRDTFGLYTTEYIEEMSRPIRKEISRIEKLMEEQDEEDV